MRVELSRLHRQRIAAAARLKAEGNPVQVICHVNVLDPRICYTFHGLEYVIVRCRRDNWSAWFDAVVAEWRACQLAENGAVYA